MQDGSPVMTAKQLRLGPWTGYAKGVLLLVCLGMLLARVPIWLRAGYGNLFMVSTLKFGIEDPRLDDLAMAARLTPERLAQQLGVQALARGEYQRAIGFLEQGAYSGQVSPMQLGF